MKKTKLAHAITLVVAGGALSLGGVSVASAAATTMYNLSTGDGMEANATDPTLGGSWENSILSGGTDGWANGASAPFYPVGTFANQQWAGTSDATAAPFGYAGAHMNWAVDFTGHSANSAEISTLDSFARYGVYADIDTAKGAWSDAVFDNARGWLHNTDTGLFRSDVSGTVTLSAAGLLLSGTNFGFTIFKGMDNVTAYAHHNGWNATTNQNGITAEFSSPYSTTIGAGFALPGTILQASDIVAYSVGGPNPSNLNTISFNAEAGQIYTIFLGGYRNGSWQITNDGYRLTVSQVPVPAAVWLFGSGLAGLVGASRRKRALVAWNAYRKD